MLELRSEHVSCFGGTTAEFWRRVHAEQMIHGGDMHVRIPAYGGGRSTGVTLSAVNPQDPYHRNTVTITHYPERG